MRSNLKPSIDWLRANVGGDPSIGVDRKAQVIHGYVVAQEGPFKSEGRGEFDEKALKQIVKLMRAAPNGLKSRFAHPTLSNDGVGKFLGRVKNPRITTIGPRESDGGFRAEAVKAVRAELHLDPTSRNTPGGDLGGYVMDLAESDPAAFSSSLVGRFDREFRLDKRGRPVRDAEGNELPPLWYAKALHASDVVDTGDAVDGMLSIDGLPDAIVRQGAALLDRQFAGLSKAVVRARCETWLQRYLNRRFGPKAAKPTRRQPRWVRWLAVPYDEVIQHHYGWESFRRGAFRLTLQSPSPNVEATVDHAETPFATTAEGTLFLRDSPEGIWATATLPNSISGRQIARRIRSGELCGGSFRHERYGGKNFDVIIDGRRALGTTITSAGLTEVCLSSDPAYSQTRGTIKLID